jgi:hypothetical protein
MIAPRRLPRPRSTKGFEETQLDRMIQATQEENSRHSDISGEAKVFRAFN